MPSTCCNLRVSVAANDKYLPVLGKIFKSGSKVVENDNVKSFSPANPANTMNNAAAPSTTTTAVTLLIILITFCELLAKL